MKKHAFFNLVMYAALLWASAGCEPPDGTDNNTSTTTSVKAESPDDLLSAGFEPVTGKGTAPPGAGESGPWAMRLMLAESPDGLTFTRTGEIVADQAGVPDIIVDHQGRLRVYYQAWQNHSPPGNTDGDFMAFAIRDPDNGTWYYHKVVLDQSYSATAVDPSVALLDDGTYRLYYMADTGDFDLNIFSAVSALGIDFSVEQGARLDPDKEIFDPMVLQTDSGWLMIAGSDGQYSATSADGVSFTRTGPFTVGGRRFHAWSGTVLPGGGYRLYGYFTDDGGLTSVSSNDGSIWTADGGYRLTEEGADTTVEAGIVSDCSVTLLSDGTFLMAYLAHIPD